MAGTTRKRAPRSKPDGKPPEGLHEQIVASLSSGVLAVDGAGCVVVANHAAAHHLNLDDTGIAPGTPLDSVPALAGFAALFDELRNDHVPASRRELTLPTSNGDKIVGVSASPLRGTDSFNGAIFLFVDLTTVRQLERSAEINRQLAQIGELTAGVVHELRNPLSVISGMAELLMRRMGDGSPHGRHVATIHHEAIELEKLIRHFLLFARPFGIERSRCAAEEVVDRAYNLCERMAREKEVSIKVHPLEEAPVLEVDYSRLAQALANLVRNAIEILRSGGTVEITTVLEPNNRIAFIVEDDGPGIHVAPNEDLLSPFVSKKEGGTGLGLSICHRIVSAHGGNITYGNREGGGAWFKIVVPVVPEPLAQA